MTTRTVVLDAEDKGTELTHIASARVARHTIFTLAAFSITGYICLVSLHGTHWSLYGILAFSLLGVKLALSLLPSRNWTGRIGQIPTVGVVITVFNEDPLYLRKCLDSIIQQTLPPQKVVVVDDASATLECHRVAQEYELKYPGTFYAVRHCKNKGKRHGLATGFRMLDASCEVFLGVDSDTVLQKHAIENGARPFIDPSIAATTGVVVAENHDKNILTRIIDVRYINAFLTERAAYSRLGSVLCVCGSLAFYRASAVMPRLDGFLNQFFLGERANAGDDRHLTNLCLLSGKVVLVENSICETAVPEKVSHYVRQQVRWGRSFFRESWWVFRHRTPLNVVWWLTLIEVLQWIILTTLLCYMITYRGYTDGLTVLLPYLAFVALMAVGRSVRYFDVVRSDQSLLSRVASFSVSPAFGFLTFFVVMPMRFYSLATLSSNSWGTRNSVEVESS